MLSSQAENRMSWPVRHMLIVAALASCGSFAACSEMPKLSKPEQPAPSSADTREAAPPPVANEPAKPDQDKQKEAQSPGTDEKASSPDDGRKKYHKARRRDDAPSTAEEKPAPAPEAGPPTDNAQGPSGGAAPPSESVSPSPPPPPPPPPSLGQGAPAPAAEPPPPAAEVQPSAPAPPPAPSMPAPVTAAPPAAPATAARAAAEADPSKTYDVVPVFYGTDRATEPDPKRLQFGSERGHKLQLGRALVTVPLSHKVPHIERPWLIEIPYFKVKVYEEKEDPAKHFTVQEISSLTEEQMLALVKERLAQSSTFKDHALVFVHGFNTSFDCALYRTAQIAYDLKFDGAPFVYSWPSGGAVASYTYDHGSVEQAEPTLAEFLKLVVQKSGAKSISLIAHSMGNELLLRVLQTLRPQVPEGVVISQVILAAPDVDRDKFNIIAREITNFAKGVTLYAASNDRALGYSARFWGGVPRAGDVPKNGGPLIIPGVDTIDVTAVSTDALGLNHSGYAENPALLNDVKALVEFGLRPPDKRIKDVLTVQSEAGTFWRFAKPN